MSPRRRSHLAGIQLGQDKAVDGVFRPRPVLDRGNFRPTNRPQGPQAESISLVIDSVRPGRAPIDPFGDHADLVRSQSSPFPLGRHPRIPRTTSPDHLHQQAVGSLARHDRLPGFAALERQRLAVQPEFALSVPRTVTTETVGLEDRPHISQERRPIGVSRIDPPGRSHPQQDQQTTNNQFPHRHLRNHLNNMSCSCPPMIPRHRPPSRPHASPSKTSVRKTSS